MFFEKVRVSAGKLEIDCPKLPRKRKVSSSYGVPEVPVGLVSTAKKHYRQIYYLATDMLVNCILDRFQQKDYI